MSTGPTPIGIIAQEYVQNFVQGEINEANSNAYANYQNVFSNWAIQQIGAPPAPPQLKVLNQALALQLFITYSNTAYQGAIGSKVALLDLSSAISTVQAAPIQLPPPAIPAPPSDPVGPPDGSFVTMGAETYNTYYNVAGETPAQYPNGTKFTDSRGTFLHIENATPFGISSRWALIPSAAPATTFTTTT